MKKKAQLISFIAMLFLTFGITDLNFDNLNFADNYKAYIFMIVGVLLMVINFIRWRRLNKEK